MVTQVGVLKKLLNLKIVTKVCLKELKQVMVSRVNYILIGQTALSKKAINLFFLPSWGFELLKSVQVLNFDKIYIYFFLSFK